MSFLLGLTGIFSKLEGNGLNLIIFAATNAVHEMQLWGNAVKNSGGQISSFLRTCYYGDYWADMAQSRSNGLPPSAFSRENSMSDKHQALLGNPWFLIDNPVPWPPAHKEWRTSLTITYVRCNMSFCSIVMDEDYFVTMGWAWMGQLLDIQYIHNCYYLLDLVSMFVFWKYTSVYMDISGHQDTWHDTECHKIDMRSSGKIQETLIRASPTLLWCVFGFLRVIL